MQRVVSQSLKMTYVLGAYGYSVGMSFALALALALAMVKGVVPGDEVEVIVLGQPHKAKILHEPPFDPTGEKLRA